MSGVNYECSFLVPDIPKDGENVAVVILREGDTINDPGSTKNRLRGPGTARVTRYSDGGIGMEFVITADGLIVCCPICGGGIQSHTIVTQEYEGLTLAMTESGNLVIEDEGTLAYEDYTGPFSGTEVYCENDHSDEDMAAHLREQSKNV